MAEIVSKPEVMRSVPAGQPEGFTATVAWGANLAEKALAIPFGLARAVRGELFRATYAGIDWVEGMNQSSFKIAREAVRSVDKLTQEFVEGLESMAGTGATLIRASGESAGDVVARTAASVLGTRQAPTT